jgi:hypothetical protein
MKGRPQREAIEAMECGRRRTRGPSWLADVQQQGHEVRTRILALQWGPERVDTDLFEEAALDSATKLTIGQLDIVCLLPSERSQLTFRRRRDAAITRGHAGQ